MSEKETMDKAAVIIDAFAAVIQAVVKYERHQQSAELTLQEIKDLIMKGNI